MSLEAELPRGASTGSCVLGSCPWKLSFQEESFQEEASKRGFQGSWRLGS